MLIWKQSQTLINIKNITLLLSHHYSKIINVIIFFIKHLAKNQVYVIVIQA